MLWFRCVVTGKLVLDRVRRPRNSQQCMLQAHPVIFEGGGNSGFSSFLQTFGAVKVGPTSFFR